MTVRDEELRQLEQDYAALEQAQAVVKARWPDGDRRRG
jgi:hypothetical protein